MKHFSLSQMAPPVDLLQPATDAAGRTSGYKSAKYANHIAVVCHINQGNAAQVTLTLLQAKDASGTGSKALTPVGVYADQDTATSNALAAQTVQNTFQTSAATKRKIVVFEIDPAEFDQANGFSFYAIQTSASNAANITAAVAYIVPRYHGVTLPSDY